MRPPSPSSLLLRACVAASMLIIGGGTAHVRRHARHRIPSGLSADMRALTGQSGGGGGGGGRSSSSAPSALASALVGGGDCFGLPKAACHACPPKETNMCEGTTKACTDSFCSPLCTQLAWTCDVAVSAGDFGAGVSPAERAALCAQVVGHACGTTFACCAADDALRAWVVARASDEATGAPLLPLAACIHDSANASEAKRVCNACKGALRLKPAANLAADACRFGSAQMAGKSDTPTPGGGALHSLEERCRALAKKLSAKLATLQKEATTKLCECAGCCDVAKGKDTCYFPMFEAI